MTLLVCVPCSARQLTRDELVRALSSADEYERREAIRYIRTNLPAEQRGSLVEQALAKELERVNEAVRKRIEADRAGMPLNDAFPEEYYAELVGLVSQSSNPVVLPPLVGALGTGTIVQKGIAKFGDEAVPHVVKIARLKVGLVTTGAPGDVPPHVVSGALKTLVLLLEQPDKPLTTHSRATIEKVAYERLTGRQEGGVVAAACQLAIATRAPALRRRVEQIAIEANELEAMGIADAKWIDFVQSIARKSLEKR